MMLTDTLLIVDSGNKAARFRRSSWETEKYVTWMVNSKNKDHVNPVISQDDLCADDWEVVSE